MPTGSVAANRESELTGGGKPLSPAVDAAVVLEFFLSHRSPELPVATPAEVLDPDRLAQEALESRRFKLLAYRLPVLAKSPKERR